MTGTALVLLAGAGQLMLAAASLAIPHLLGWREELRRLSALTRSVFWTYAGYILGTNIALGLISALAPGALLDDTLLARAVCAYAALYWGVRLVIQLVSFGRHAPPGAQFKLAEAGLLVLFVYLTGVYAGAAAGALGPGALM